jgi:hypothetical protein
MSRVFFYTYFTRLVREGRAEFVCGPHCALHWHPVLQDREPGPDARYTYRCRMTGGLPGGERQGVCYRLRFAELMEFTKSIITQHNV